MGTNIYVGKDTALTVLMRKACAYKRDVPTCVRIRLWPLRHDDSSLVLIGAAGRWRSDWRRRDVGVLIGQSACRLLALTREAVDSTRAEASGSLQSATTDPYKVLHGKSRRRRRALAFSARVVSDLLIFSRKVWSVFGQMAPTFERGTHLSHSLHTFILPIDVYNLYRGPSRPYHLCGFFGVAVALS